MATVRRVDDLGVRHLGGIVRTNGYIGELAELSIAEDPSYIEIALTDPETGGTTRTWVKPDAPAAVEP